ncbi:MAG: aminoacyl-tRNA hydrolase [Verrucomicrobia bacterium]|nr:aminoacyl-tRNA hydrolase [Verrucomicrobiota bacterium]
MCRRRGARVEDLHLIVGLGNPGGEYARTRHNAGFQLTERLAGQWSAGWRNERAFKAWLAEAAVGRRRCLLARPQTYMNASGEAVAALVKNYQVAVARVLVVVDDADLPLGELRMRTRGGSGGHHGLESVEQHLGRRDYPRLRLGIGRQQQAADREITGHVLGRFRADEWATFEKVLERGGELVCCWLQAGATVAMNRFNGVVDTPQPKDH